mgnify:CR=1 FL=1
MPSVTCHLRKLCILGLLAFPAHAADDWQDVTVISGTVGNNTNRLCMGVPDHMRPSDIGCPSFAPSLTTGGHVSITGNVSANKFVGDGSGLTNLNVQGDRITSGSHAVVANENTGSISMTTGGSTWGYFSAGWSRLSHLFANTVSSTVVSATNVSATYVDTTRGGTVSGTYGYFQHISGTYLSGDGAGLYNVPASAVSGLNLDRITSGSHALIANQGTGYVSLTTGGSTWGYLSAGWSRLANLFANTVSSTLVSATNVSATYVDTTRGGTVSGTYGYFRFISGTDIHGRFTGDGSGLTGVTAAASDRIVSGSTGGTRMVAVSETGYISITQAGANSGWFDPTRGLVTLGVSATGAISGTRGYFRETVGIGTLAPVGALHIAGLSHSRSVRLSSDLGAYTELGILNNTASWFDVNPHPHTASENSTIRFFRHVSTTGVAEVIFHRGDGGGDPVAVIGNTRIALGMNGINVGIGLWSTGARLGVAGTISATDAIQVGSSSLTCGAGIAGALRYSGSKIEYCNGTAWGALVGAAEAMGDRIVSGSTNIIAHQDRSLTFTTNNQQRMVIAEDGRVGVGSSAPQGRLHVSTPDSTPALFLSRDGDANVSIAFASSLGSSLIDGGGSGGHLRFFTAGQQRMLLNSEGNIVIGSAYAGSSLTIAGEAQVGNSGGACNSAQNAGAIRYTAGNLLFCNNANTWITLGTAGATTAASSTGAVQFNVNNQLAGDTDNFFWDNTNKRLGIGISAPPVALTVSSSGYEAIRIVGHGATGGASAGYMSFYDSNGLTRYGFIGDASSNADDTSLYLRADVGNLHLGDSSDVQVVTLRGGHVGVGTATPTATLQVSGSFIVSTSAQAGTSASLFVGSNGLIGVGTSNPLVNLHVAGNGVPMRIDSTNGNAFKLGWASNGVVNGFIGAGAGAPLVVGSSGGLIRMYMLENGNVGISTTTPRAKLDVAGTISASDAIQVGTSSLTCNAGLSGALRYNSTHSTMEYCNSAAWNSLGPSGTTVLGQVMRVTTPQSIANGTWSAVTFNVEMHDTHDLVNLGTHADRITVPAGMGGYYLIESQGSYDSAGTNYTGRWISLTRNGVQLSGSYCNAVSGPIGGYHGLNCTYMAYLSAGDYVGMQAYHNNGAALNLTGARLSIVKLDGGGTGGSGGGANTLNELVDVNTAGASTGSILAYNGTQWVVSNSGAGTLSGLADVNLSSLAGRDYLRYDHATSRWVNISESTVMSTTTIVPNWPDALNCSSAAGSASIVNLTTSVAGALRVYGFNAGGSSVGYQIHFNNDGSWNTIINSPGWADVAGCTGKSIAQLYGEGRAFNFIGNSGVSGGALGDRLTSGTHAVTVNTASGIISLTTGGTSWGYLASGNSYLPLLTSGRVSSTNISGTLIQAGASTAACNAGLAGGIRYSAVSNTLQVCTGTTGWKSLTSGTAVSSLATLTDVNITDLAGRDYLRYDHAISRWVNISESTVMSTTTMVNGWPDAIMCTNSADTSAVLLMVHSLKGSDNTHYYYYPGSTSYFARFNGDGSYNTGGYQTTAGPHPCQNRTITQLYASGQAFNFIGNSATGGGGALGDRLTSGTLPHAVTVNSATGVVSLSIGGTTWGYLNSTRSYLPALSSGQVSSTNVSATLLQVGTGNGAECDAARRGAMRYSTTSNTLEYCNSSAWVSTGPSTSVPAFVVTKSSNQTVPIGTWTKVTWNNEVADSNNNFDMSNSRFTPTVPGYYHLNGSLQCNTSSTSCSAGIYKNGALVYMSMMVGNTPITNVSGMVYLNGAGDYVELYGYDSGGSTFRGYAAYTYFSGALMGGGGGTGGGGGGSSDLAGLSDVNLTSLAGRDYLRYDAGTSRWVNVPESTVMSTTTMVPGWPDAIQCTDNTGLVVIMYLNSAPSTDGRSYYYEPAGSGSFYYIGFNSDGSYHSQASRDYVSCKTSISSLYASGKAFNFIGNSGVSGGNAPGDRITSGTHTVTVNTASGVVSLSTAGTTWGYLNSTRSYLPTLTSTHVSSTNVSATLLQVGTGNGAACDASRRGAMRYSTISSTMEYCNSSAWVSLGPSATAVPSFYVHRNGVAQNGIPNQVTTAIDWTHKLFDTNNNFNLADERFTPTVPGTYLLNGNAFCESTNWCAAVLYKNGVVIQDSYNKTPNSGGISSNASVIVHANGSTDYFEMRVFMTGTQLIGGQTQTNFSGVLISMAGGGGGSSDLAGLTDVNTAGASTGSILAYNGSQWVVSSSGAGTLSGLSDVNLTSLAGRDYLRYDHATSRWVNISESTVMSTTTILPGFPDAISCSNGTNTYIIPLTQPANSNGLTYYQYGTAWVGYNTATKAYSSQANLAGYDCVTNAWSIPQLYEQGRAFNFIGSSGAGGGNGVGDRITSGTHTVAVNTASGVVSLSTAGTTWGYLSSGNSYLPLLTSGRVSSTNISGTLIQAGDSAAACDAGLAGGIRYNAVSNTLQVCTGTTGWKSLTSGTAVSSLGALTDVNITSLAGRDYLRYDAGTSRWVNISESTVMSTTTMVPAFPDAIRCNSASNNIFLFLSNITVASNVRTYIYPGSATLTVNYNPNGTYNSQTNMAAWDCVSSTKSIATLYAEGNAYNFIGNSGANGGSGVSAMVSLTDVSLSNLAGRDYLRYDAGTSRWVNVSESTVMSTTTIVPGWPDRIYCTGPSGDTVFDYYLGDTGNGTVTYRPAGSVGAYAYMAYNYSTGAQTAYDTTGGFGNYMASCNGKGIAQLYSDGQAFNLIGNSGANGGNAHGDRITSGTLPHAVVVTSATGVVSLRAGGTTWGYFGNAASYLPGLLTVGGSVSVTGNVSATGSVQAFSFLHPSDARLKSDIATIPNAVEILDALRGTQFKWTSNGNFSYGLIAQEIEKVMPSAVQGTDSKVVDYNQFIAVLVEGWKAHHNAIASLKAANDGLAQRAQNFELTNDGLRRWNLQLREELETVKADNDNLRAEFTALRGEVQQLRQANAP